MWRRSISTDVDAAVLIKCLMRGRDREDRLPVMMRETMHLARGIIGIKAETYSGVMKWRVPADWPDRLKRAGIDPQTLELVDLEAWKVAVRGEEQKRIARGREEVRGATRESLSVALRKYGKPKPQSLEEVRSKHYATKRLLREIEREVEQD